MIPAGQLQEHIGYRRSDAVPGLEILDAYHSPRQWRVMGYDYAVTFLRTWRGDVKYRGRVNPVERGIAFCNYPGEALIATPEPDGVGSFNVLLVNQDLIQQWAAEHRTRAPRLEWRAIFPRISQELWLKFQCLSSSLNPEASAMQVQSDAAELAEVLVRDLVAGASDPAPSDGPALRGTARMRELLNAEGLDVDLETLAQRAGLSRFQALRAFKRRYGLPPHAYQLCLRISTARVLLMGGAAPAEVAAQCGFVDQSHLNRHFKRIVGVTPMQYVLSNVGSKGAAKTTASAAQFARSTLQRSDWRRA